MQETKTDKIRQETDKWTSILKDFSTCLLVLDRINRQITQGREDWTRLHQPRSLFSGYTTLHPTSAEFTFFLSTCHSDREQSLTYIKKKIEITQSIFSNHNIIKLEINNKKITGNSLNNLKFKNQLYFSFSEVKIFLYLSFFNLTFSVFPVHS